METRVVEAESELGIGVEEASNRRQNMRVKVLEETTGAGRHATGNKR